MFGGLGEVVRELREFVKDLWYRNRLEHRLLELEVQKRELALAREMPQAQLPKGREPV
jgi:hypothetical protein